MGISIRRRLLATMAIASVAALTLAGCAEAEEGGATKPGDGGSLEGQTVKISGGITGGEAHSLNEAFAAFEKETGIEVTYTGDKGFEGNIVTKVTGGSAPDIAIVPQPGLLNTLVGTGEAKAS